VKLSVLAERLGLVRFEDAPASPPDADFSSQVLPPSRERNVDALSLDMTYRSVQIIQTAVGQLSVDAWRGRQLLDERPGLVAQPNPWISGDEFYQTTAASMALRGEAFWAQTRNGDSPVTGLDVIPPLEVEPLGGGKFSWRGKETTAISHIKLMAIPGRKHGLGPIQACMESFDAAKTMRSYADNFLDESNIPNAVLTTDKELSTGSAELYKQAVQKAAKPGNSPMVLGHGLKYAPLMLSPKEMLWIDAQQFNAVSLARLFGIPPRLALVVIEGSSETYANLEQEMIQLTRFTLMTYLTGIENALTALLPRGQVARFNLDAMLRTDTLTRYQAYKIGKEAGFLTIEEIRAQEHLG
jgi:HK97 family phage portal protein